MRVGIVGHEQAKFTPATERAARALLSEALDILGPTTILSGHCPLGGVDIWAEEIAAERGVPMIVHAPKTLTWSGPFGYKARNLAIARGSDLVICVALRELPRSFAGPRFEACYHCAGRNPPHVKGGGCWTAWRCKSREWLFV